jgi:hypothetical protein
MGLLKEKNRCVKFTRWRGQPRAYARKYSIPQRALGHLSPVQALKQWRIKQAELFAKRVYKQVGLGNYALPHAGRSLPPERVI